MSSVPFDPTNPFPGLRAFAEGEADRFFGRREQIGDLAGRLTRLQFVAVTGNSGCGKSSLVRAGLLRELDRLTADPGAVTWRPVIMLPGNQPIANLSKALSTKLHLTESDDTGIGLLYGQLKLGGLGLVDAVRRTKLAPNTRVLLVVDQFEELFRLKQADPDEASAFVKLLLNAALDAQSAVSLIITLRSDSLGYCADFRGLPEAINRSLYLVPKLTRDQRKEAIVGPVELRSRRITARLVQRILNDVSDDFDDLPVMQHALLRTWNRWASASRDSRPIDLEDYEAIGTTANAISIHADEAAAATQQQPVVEKVFCALTERQAHGEVVRRALAFDKLCEVVGERRAVEEVVERFRQPDTVFLRPGQDVPLASDPIIDISHESLIRQWRKLGDWVTADAESVAMLRRVVEAARLYEANEGSLWSGRTLERAREWRKPTPAWVRLHVSGDVESTWHAAERFLGESERQDQNNRRQRRLLLNSLYSLGLVILGVAVYVAVLRSYQKDEFYSNLRSSEALASIDQDPAKSAHLALAALGRSGRNQLAELALRQSMARLEVAHTVSIIEPCDAVSGRDIGKQRCDPVRDVRYSPDGSRLLVAAGKVVTLFDSQDFRQIGARIERGANVLQAWLIHDNRILLTRTEDLKVQLQHLGKEAVRPLICPSDNHVWIVAPSRDNRHVAIGCHEGEVLVWDVTQAAEQPKYKFRRNEKKSWSVTALDFSNDGAFLASGDYVGKIAVWKLGRPGVWLDHVGAGKNERRLEHDSGKAVRDIHFYEDDTSLLVTAGDDNQSIVWKLNLERAPLTKEQQEEQRRWSLKHERAVTAAKFFPDKFYPVVTVSGKIAQRWEDETNDPKQMRAHDDWVKDVNISPDGKLMVTACADGTGRIWSTRSGPPIVALRGHRGAVNRALFSPKGDTVLTASDDGSVRVWRFRAPEVLASFNHWALGAAFDPSGTRVAVTDESREACVLTPSAQTTCSDEQAKKLNFGQGALSELSWSKDGKYLIATGTRNEIDNPSKQMLWEIADGETTESPALSNTYTAVFRRDGDELLTLNLDGRLALWDTKKLEAPDLQPLLGLASEGWGALAISPDGKWIAVARGQDIELWHRNESQSKPTRLVGHGSRVMSLRFSVDSTRLVSASTDRTARIWSLAAPDKPTPLEGGHAGVLYSASFDPTGQWVVTGSADGTIGFWNAHSGHLLASLRWHGEVVNTVEFSPDGRKILSASDDGTVRLGQCESCALPLAKLKARVSEMAKLSKDDETQLRRKIGR